MATRTLNFVEALVQSGDSKSIIERRLATYAMGVIDALESGELSLSDAENDLFNIVNYQLFKRKKLNRALIELLEWGLELEDVQESAPHGMGDSYRAIRRLAASVIARKTI